MNKFVKSRRITFSKINSRNLSVPESKFWFEVLSSRKLEGLRFVKQRVIDKYIVDFYLITLQNFSFLQ
jgi:very-short-patch-repair endonuclease